MNKKEKREHTTIENFLRTTPCRKKLSKEKGRIAMNVIDKIALTLVVIGGINWGSVGLFQYDLVGALFGGMSSVVSRIVFTLVGISALWCISLLFRGSDD